MCHENTDTLLILPPCTDTGSNIVSLWCDLWVSFSVHITFNIYFCKRKPSATPRTSMVSLWCESCSGFCFVSFLRSYCVHPFQQYSQSDMVFLSLHCEPSVTFKNYFCSETFLANLAPMFSLWCESYNVFFQSILPCNITINTYRTYMYIRF